jgi:hypothetical protein
MLYLRRIRRQNSQARICRAIYTENNSFHSKVLRRHITNNDKNSSSSSSKTISWFVSLRFRTISRYPRTMQKTLEQPFQQLMLSVETLPPRPKQTPLRIFHPTI